MNRLRKSITPHGVTVLLAGGALWLGMGSVVGAQRTPTDPSRTWIYCWGYHESAGRQYHCVSSEARQPIMASFLPAEGTRCDGRIRGYSRGRTGIQLDCDDGAWTKSGTGDDFFTKPGSAVRVRITTSYSGESANFQVYCETHDDRRRIVVNELLGTRWENAGTEGVYRMVGIFSPCIEVDVMVNPVEDNSRVSWTFRQLDALVAYSPPRHWSHVTGVGLDLDAEALQHLAIAVENERAGAAEQPRVR